MKHLLNHTLISVVVASCALARMSVPGILMAGVVVASAQAETLHGVIHQGFDGVTAPDLAEDWTTGTVDTSHTQPNHVFAANSTGISRTSLVSPPLVPTHSMMLRFQQLFELFASGSGGLAALEIALDGVRGGAFQEILHAGGEFISGNCDAHCHWDAISLFRRDSWSGHRGGPVVVTLRTAAQGKIVRLRWRPGTASGNPSFDRRWFVDTIQTMLSPRFSRTLSIAKTRGRSV